MFDIGWEKLLLISTVALIAIGPKDLPKALRTAGRAVGKMRRMANEFQSQFNEAIREADLEDLRKAATDLNDAITPFKSEFNPLKNVDEQLQKAVGPLSPPAEEPVVPPPEPEAAPAPKKKPARKTTSKKVADSAADTPSTEAPAENISAPQDGGAGAAEAEKPAARRAKAPTKKKTPVPHDPSADAGKAPAAKKPPASRAKKKTEKPGENAK